MCSAHHDLPVGQGFTAVNKLEMLAWSGEGYESSLGKKPHKHQTISHFLPQNQHQRSGISLKTRTKGSGTRIQH